MTRWSVFAGLTGVILVLVVTLARVSQDFVAPDEGAEDTTDDVPESGPATVRSPELDPSGVAGPGSGSTDDTDPGSRPSSDGTENGDSGDELPDRTGEHGDPTDSGRPGTAAPEDRETWVESRSPDPVEQISTPALLVNVALSHGLFASLLVGGIFYAGVPASALGLAVPTVETVFAGVGLGGALYLANRVGVVVAGRFGIGHSERLRELLAPSTASGWILLLGVVLPLVAGFEELLFRAALVGAIPAGFGVSPWVMVVLSSGAFGVGHGTQGQGGVLVTGVLGLVLAVAYLLTGSFVVVFVAHYLVNALEFVVHEGLGIEWGLAPE